MVAAAAMCSRVKRAVAPIGHIWQGKRSQTQPSRRELVQDVPQVIGGGTRAHSLDAAATDRPPRTRQIN